MQPDPKHSSLEHASHCSDHEQQSTSASALLAAIVESSDDAIISKNLEGRILSWNAGAERIFGYSAAEAVGKPITLIIPAECQHEESTIIEKIGRGERIDHFETIRVAKDGRRVDISLTISPVRDHTGKIVGASKVARDITTWKLTELALRESDRRKDEFLATLAHELRNPLAPISNSLQILQMSNELSPTASRVCGIMERQVNHLIRLVDDLLEISRITRNKIELRKEPVELAAILRNAVETSLPLLERAGHQLAISVPSDPIILRADPVRVAQVIANLLNNAAKYTPPGGQIWLNGRREGREAVVSVRDNGLGIAPNMLGKIFEMFEQGEHTLDRAQGGLGIGLTLAKALVQMHGGKIEATSSGLGQGSEFIVRLPLETSTEEDSVSARPPSNNPITSPSRRIMIVDDTRDSVFVLGKLLEKLGHKVSVNHDAGIALHNARLERPDLIISDIAMPKMDGYEFARRVRQEPSLAGVTLVALSGYGQESHRKRAKEAGFDYHLVKPVSLEMLEMILTSIPSENSSTADSASS